MEGKEVRFGIAASSLFATVTTDSSSGAVDAMHDSFMPLSGGLLMANMMLDEVIVGGVGSGLYGVLLFCIVTVFVGGLMVGRTPEYVGKKIQASEVKLTMLALLCVPGTILGLTSVACVIAPGLAGIANPGPHGFSEILYAYTSAAATNGSAFAGLNANTAFYNLTLALAMFSGRFLVIVPVLAVAGSLAAKPLVPASAGTLPTTGVLFVSLLTGVILIVGGLTFVPAFTLGPIANQRTVPGILDMVRLVGHDRRQGRAGGQAGRTARGRARCDPDRSANPSEASAGLFRGMGRSDDRGHWLGIGNRRGGGRHRCVCRSSPGQIMSELPCYCRTNQPEAEFPTHFVNK